MQFRVSVENIAAWVFTFIVLSLLAVANQLHSGCQSQANTGPECAVNWCVHLSGRRTSHSCTFPFSDTAANAWNIWGLNCTSLMLSVLLQLNMKCWWKRKENIEMNSCTVISNHLINVLVASFIRMSKHFIVPSWEPDISQWASVGWKLTLFTVRLWSEKTCCCFAWVGLSKFHKTTAPFVAAVARIWSRKVQQEEID